MVPEAVLTETEAGLMPEGHGWFVVNARDVRRWQNDKFGRPAGFEGDSESRGGREVRCEHASGDDEPEGGVRTRPTGEMTRYREGWLH